MNLLLLQSWLFNSLGEPIYSKLRRYKLDAGEVAGRILSGRAVEGQAKHVDTTGCVVGQAVEKQVASMQDDILGS